MAPHQRIKLFRGRRRRAGIGHLQRPAIRRVKQILPGIGHSQAVLLDKIPVDEKTQRRHADAEPTIVRIAIPDRHRFGRFGNVPGQRAFAFGGIVNVGRTANDQVSLRTDLFGDDAPQHLAR